MGWISRKCANIKRVMTFVRLIGESPHEQVNPILSCSVKSAKERWCSISISVPRCSLAPVYC
ncbi:Uncharacterised protein [Vibrio cholerae]|nr:Uncharacterised protein [Vibrio cholerae]